MKARHENSTDGSSPSDAAGSGTSDSSAELPAVRWGRIQMVLENQTALTDKWLKSDLQQRPD